MRPTSEQELRDAQRRLQADLDATSRLLRIGSLFLRDGNLQYVLGEIVEAAIAISGASFGSIQILDRESGDLRIAAHRGFPAWWIDYWDTPGKARGAWAQALELRQRVVVADIERHPPFAGTEALEIQRRAGVRGLASTPLLSRAGEPIGMMSTYCRAPCAPGEHSLQLMDLVARQAADILERARVERELRAGESRLHALVDVSSEVLYRMSPDWTEMRELTSHGFLATTPTASKTWLDRYILPDDQPCVTAAIEHAIKTKGVFELEHRVVRADGTTGWTWSRAVPVKDERGEVIEWFGAASDVTARKRAEMELAEANERLRENDRRKNAFLAVLSHELRNPLASIEMCLDLIERVPQGSKQASRSFTVIRRQFGHLTHLIDDLLDVTRITSGKIALRRELVELTALVRQTADDQRDAFDGAGLSLDIVASDAVHVDGDPTRLAQVITNLLHNALKFTPRGGRVTVTVAADRHAGQALVRVHDTGLGIPPEILPRVFEPFVQADTSLDRSMGGLGLGLAVARGLIDLHGGSITATTDGGDHGTTFSIALPLDTHHAAATAPARRRVLVIEDNRDTADALCSLLDLDGYETDVAYDGAAGLEHARSFTPDIVVCDVGLPKLNGYEVARAMRSDPLLGHAALVAMTGYGAAEDLAMAKEAGFDAHLTKPIGADDLARVLTSIAG